MGQEGGQEWEHGSRFWGEFTRIWLLIYDMVHDPPLGVDLTAFEHICRSEAQQEEGVLYDCLYIIMGPKIITCYLTLTPVYKLIMIMGN